MVDTDFDNETLGAVHSSTRWELGDGSATGLAFTGASGDIQVSMSSTGECRELHRDEPLTAHQRCAVVMLSATTHGTEASFGVVVRYQDGDNYIRAMWDYQAGAVEVIERIAGVETTLASVSATPTGGSSLALEVIGRRARLWYETSALLPGDRPPDIAATLTSLNKGGWGIFADSNATNDARFTRFVARDMPNAVMPPPAFSVQDASDLGISLSPIDAIASGVSGTAGYLEWEVAPADPDDFPEAYTDLTPPTTTSRVFFARPGYAYDLRVREISVDGVLGVWSSAARVTVAGTKAPPDDGLMPADEFPDAPADYVMPVSQTADFSAVISDTGRERVQGLLIRPRTTIKLTYKNRQGAEIQSLIDFFDEMRGKRKPFKWTHPTTGRVFAMRFDMDDYTIKYPDRGVAGIIASFDLTLTEVIFGSVTTIAPTITLDDDA